MFDEESDRGPHDECQRAYEMQKLDIERLTEACSHACRLLSLRTACFDHAGNCCSAWCKECLGAEQNLEAISEFLSSGAVQCRAEKEAAAEEREACALLADPDLWPGNLPSGVALAIQLAIRSRGKE